MTKKHKEYYMDLCVSWAQCREQSLGPTPLNLSPTCYAPSSSRPQASQISFISSIVLTCKHWKNNGWLGTDTGFSPCSTQNVIDTYFFSSVEWLFTLILILDCFQLGPLPPACLLRLLRLSHLLMTFSAQKSCSYTSCPSFGSSALYYTKRYERSFFKKSFFWRILCRNLK